MNTETPSEVQRLAAEPEAEAITMADLLEDLPRKSWSVGSLADADYALERIASVDAQLDEQNVLLEAAIARLRSRHEKLTAPLHREKDFFEGELRRYAERARGELLPKGKKSRALPHGTIGWRGKAAQLVVKDEEALLAWAKTATDEDGKLPFLKVVESTDWALVKKHFAPGTEDVNEDTGVATPRKPPPGTDVEAAGETFYAKAE